MVEERFEFMGRMVSEALFEELDEGFQISANALDPKIEWLASQLVDGRPWSRDSGSIAVVSPTRSNISNEMLKRRYEKWNLQANAMFQGSSG